MLSTCSVYCKLTQRSIRARVRAPACAHDVLIYFCNFCSYYFLIFSVSIMPIMFFLLFLWRNFAQNLIHNKKMETVIFKVFASATADKPVMERILYPKSGDFLNYDQIISSLHQLFGDGSVVVVSHEMVKK